MMKERNKDKRLWKLKKERKKIDVIDQNLLNFLNQRQRIVLKIGKIKKEMGKGIYDPRREKEVLERLKRKNKGPLKEKDIEKIFSMIMKVCRKSEI
ncbi:MAG: chorismate mutase [Syntrophaceae bacterium]|nr:chorismate mutase [Syntrophaceae bacterium]